MRECLCPPRPDDPAERWTCPRSGTPGHVVGLQTVKALLTEQALARISGSPHRFCPDPDCDIVYFTRTGTFGIGDVRVPVWQKAAAGARMVCYCFGENEADISREIAELGTSRAVERVREHIAAGRCACELRNPRGDCCLGDVMAAVKRATVSASTDRKIADRM
jgi:CopZ-like zinc binding protein